MPGRSAPLRCVASCQTGRAVVDEIAITARPRVVLSGGILHQRDAIRSGLLLASRRRRRTGRANVASVRPSERRHSVMAATTSRASRTWQASCGGTRAIAEASMKLKPPHSLPSMKLAGRVPGELHADLTAYAVYYREVVGQSIDLWPLVVQMVRTFVDSDRAFHAWRRRHRSSARGRLDGIQGNEQES